MDHRPTYWLTRWLILRSLGVVYAVAFLVTINQVIPLVGTDGLLPAGAYLQRITDIIGPATGFLRVPSIFWLGHSDAAMLVAAWAGLILSCVVIAGYANAIMLLVLWFLYMSFVNVGQEWYSFGWEIQLLETGFLAVFLCPLLDARPFSRRPPPIQIIVLFRWLIFRIMLGSGLIKLRGDEVWRNSTALYYHFETQPIPGPLSRWFHFMPRWILRSGVWFNWLAELIAPWFAFGPRIARHVAGIIMILLQIILVFSGNLSFLNWLTIVPALACFDDGFWSRLLPKALVRRADAAKEQADPYRPMEVTAWIITAIIGFLSIQPAVNMLSTHQIMNTSFDPLNLVNTYGAFGSVGRERMNVVFEGTMDSVPDDKAQWKEYPYKGLPVALDKASPQIAPYHLRLDWEMWFAAMSTPDEYPWTLTLVGKLLHNDPKVVGLFADNPFPGKPPRYVRAILYRYTFAPKGNKDHLWWTRERIGDTWLPAISEDDGRLQPYSHAYSRESTAQ
ncbi:MAG TPA: lipase maturation factor family protein [Puia sp.]